MAMLTGKVQVYENPSRDLEVGTAFARKNDHGEWVDLEGKLLKVVKISAGELLEKVKKKVAQKS